MSYLEEMEGYGGEQGGADGVGVVARLAEQSLRGAQHHRGFSAMDDGRAPSYMALAHGGFSMRGTGVLKREREGEDGDDGDSSDGTGDDEREEEDEETESDGDSHSHSHVTTGSRVGSNRKQYHRPSPSRRSPFTPGGLSAPSGYGMDDEVHHHLEPLRDLLKSMLHPR